MARKRKTDFHPDVPTMRRHSSGQGRVTLSGRTYYCGRFGSPEAIARYSELVQAWERAGRRPFDPDGCAVETVASLAEKTKRFAERHEIPEPAATCVLDIKVNLGLSDEEAIAVARVRHADAFCSCTVRDAMAKYEGHIDASGRYVKRGTQTSERAIITCALAELVETHGDLPIERLDSAKLIEHRDRLEQRTHLSRAGVNRKIQVIRRAMSWLRERKVVSRDQWLDVQDVRPLKRGSLTAERERKHHKRAVPFADVEKVAQAAGRVVGAMLRLQMATGCRPGEVCGLRWADIDKAPVTVGAVSCWTWHVEGAKAASHHATTYPLGPTAQRILEQFPAPAAAFIFSPRRAMEDLRAEKRASRETPPTKQMRQRDAKPRKLLAARYHVGNYAQAVDRAIVRAKVDRFTPHEVRHAYVTNAARRFGVMAAKVAANHTDIKTTSSYLHDDRDDAYRVVVGMEQPEHLPTRPGSGNREAQAG